MNPLADANVRFVNMDGGSLGVALVVTDGDPKLVQSEIYSGVAALLRAPDCGSGDVQATYPVSVGAGMYRDGLERVLQKTPLPPGIEYWTLPGTSERLFPLYAPTGGMTTGTLFYLVRG